jgi:hypothetical protein
LRQLGAAPLRVIEWVRETFEVSAGGALNTQFREKHRSAAFGSVD